MAFPGKPRTDPEAHEPALAGIGRYKYVGRLDVLIIPLLCRRPIADERLMAMRNENAKSKGWPSS